MKSCLVLLIGTYGPDENYGSQADCRQCPSGYYCEEPGLDVPTGQCYAGYYCTGGALSPTPRNHMVRAMIIHFTCLSLRRLFSDRLMKNILKSLSKIIEIYLAG